MVVTELSLRDFRSYEHAHVVLGGGITVVGGANGAGKTNLLEGLYFGCTGRSCRTNNERELVRFGAPATIVRVGFSREDGLHETSVGFEPGQPKRLRVDGAAVERLVDTDTRPLVSVFLPDRLELVKGAPTARRAHLDQLVAALWPTRGLNRRSYAQALAQRNALIARIRARSASRDSLLTWDSELARHAVALMHDRDQAVGAIAARFAATAERLGLEGETTISYRPRSGAGDAGQLALELAQRAEQDIERGYTGHGPHRDELRLALDGRELRAYGSQGQQRLALLALLLAEREAIARTRESPPLLLLDDVMSELDRDKRSALVEVVRGSGQAVITTTDLEHVPGIDDDELTRLNVEGGRVLAEAPA